MSSAGRITHLWTSSASGQPMVSHSHIQVIADCGMDGCAHGRPKGKRQVLLAESEILDVFDLQPGQIKENITTNGIHLQELPTGTQLQLGDEVIVEITMDCEPCRQIERIRDGLKKAMEGRRGMLARVHHGGLLHVGDSISILSAADRDTAMLHA